MGFLRWGYDFDGPYLSPSRLENQAGVYVLWRARGRRWDVLEVEGSGAVRDQRDKSKWHTEQGPLSVSGAKFMNWHRRAGGGGAIDLMMHLADVDFRTSPSTTSVAFRGLGEAWIRATSARDDRSTEQRRARINDSRESTRLRPVQPPGTRSLVHCSRGARL